MAGIKKMKARGFGRLNDMTTKDIFNQAANDNGAPRAQPATPAPDADIRDVLKELRAKSRARGANDNEPNPDMELLKAAEAGDLAKVKHWLKQGANIDARHVNNDTPLIIAAREGHEEIAIYLATRKEGKADASLSNKQMETALLVAACDANTPIAIALIKAGAPLNDQDKTGATAAFHAAQTGNDTLMKALAEAGADLNLPDVKNTTPLMQAVKFRHGPVMAILYDHRANLDAQDGEGMTALMHAVAIGNNLMSCSIIHEGANIELKNKEHKTAFDIAEALGHGGLADAIDEALRALNAERYGAFHTGTHKQVPAMRRLSLKPPEDKP